MKKIARLTATGAAALVSIGSAWCASAAHAQNSPGTPPPVAPVLDLNAPKKTVPLSVSARKKVFETVWSRVNERYYDPTFGGVNWKAVRTRYAPRAVAAQTDDAFYQLMQQMLDELKRSHFAIIPPGAYVAEDGMETRTPSKTATTDQKKTGERDGSAGLVIQMVENKPTITRVEKRGAAEAAGLRPGYVVTHLRNKSLETVIEKIRKSAPTPDEVPLLVRQALGGALQGAVGSDLVISYRDENDRDQTATLKRGPLPGIPSRFGELPTIYVQTESQTLPGNIGYVRFNIFLMPVLEPVKAAIAQMQKNGARGIIVDLRGNPGGIGVLAPAIAGALYDTKTDLGVMSLRQGFLRFPVYPAPSPYRGPVVILTDAGSASTSEIFAGSLQERKRAIVVGEKTAGKVMPSVIETLPGTRARLQFAFADFKTPKGVLIEGRGVVPDLPVTLTRQALLAGGDPVLDAAVTYIKERTQNPGSVVKKENK